MNKVIVEVFVPMISAQYDIFIPIHVQMGVVLDLVKQAVTDLSGRLFVADENTVICFRETGKIIDINMSIEELGITNGSRLMLI